MWPQQNEPTGSKILKRKKKTSNQETNCQKKIDLADRRIRHLTLNPQLPPSYPTYQRNNQTKL